MHRYVCSLTFRVSNTKLKDNRDIWHCLWLKKPYSGGIRECSCNLTPVPDLNQYARHILLSEPDFRVKNDRNDYIHIFLLRHALDSLPSYDGGPEMPGLRRFCPPGEMGEINLGVPENSFGFVPRTAPVVRTVIPERVYRKFFWEQGLQKLLHGDTGDLPPDIWFFGELECFVESQYEDQPSHQLPPLTLGNMILDDGISHYRQGLLSLPCMFKLVQMMKSCNGKYWFAGISADHVFATFVHGPEDPHIRSDEIHLNFLCSVDSIKVKKHADTKSGKVSITPLLRDLAYTFGFRHVFDMGVVAEFIKCEAYDLVLGDAIAGRVTS